MKKILCIGPEWRGSNAGGLFKALAKIGNVVSVVDEFYYLSLRNQTFLLKLVSKSIRKFQIADFNRAILQEASKLNPDILLVYKGAFVLPKTIVELKKKGVLAANFYPDVSFRTHGSLLAETLPLYDKVFTTKTFGIEDMKIQLGQKNGVFIPHGFDPEIHRPINLPKGNLNDYLQSDASFIGTWSAHKEELLSFLVEKLPKLNLKIWGEQWNNSTSKQLENSIQGKAITGDLYAAAIGASKINLAILSEQVIGASSGDKITSRTFHIPAAKGCMLHQYSDEIDIYFKDGEEMLTFNGKEDLVRKVKVLLEDDELRERITIKGHERAINDHSLINRAHQLLNSLN